MKIASIQPLTLSDYPPYSAAIIFTIGCNLRCDFCHNKLLWDKNHPSIDLDEIFSFLNSRKNKLDGVVITGGEPTLQNELISFTEKIKNLGYKIKLNTNGTNSSCLKKLLEKKLIDYIAMDVKNSLDFYKEKDLLNVKQSIDLISLNNIQHEFRTICDYDSQEKSTLQSILSMLPKNSKHIVCPPKNNTR